MCAAMSNVSVGACVHTTSAYALSGYSSGWGWLQRSASVAGSKVTVQLTYERQQAAGLPTTPT